jgi:hypothetical protein
VGKIVLRSVPHRDGFWDCSVLSIPVRKNNSLAALRAKAATALVELLILEGEAALEGFKYLNKLEGDEQ